MQKINFTDTTITQKPYVTINNQNYEVQDGVYTGGTDLNAQTFNDMQTNIEIAINSLCPIGNIIVRDTDEDMSNFLGFTWKKIFEGVFPVGLDTTQTEFNTVGKKGGEKTHKLTVNELPKFNLTFPAGTNATTSGDYDRAASAFAGGSPKDLATSSIGGDVAHNNLPPYQVAVWWKRIA